ncbi:PREDICTED: uncharacterized protein LOC105571112 [Vollenhovia emeryi]|uniref:uncharacterized protein LOC105571112 n=1 Tax=Vollenhovia emeryi TaxID=411798 RepID=UPI0005F38304|nr:PREDICTED: uncharacterized protein LOC105571112 [Vollenhovia emeryi]
MNYVPLDMSSKKQCNAFSNRRYMPYVPRSSYTPSVSRHETVSCKKQHDASDKPRYTPRIMSRRFALTSTAYKYLDVGICVVPDASYVEFILGDNRGNKMALNHSTWMEFNKKRAEIEQLFKSTDASSSSSVQIDNLVLELVRMYNKKVVKFTLDDTCMYMNMSTVLFLLNLEHCVEHVYRKLSKDIEAVNESFDEFVCCLQSNMTSAERDDAIGILYEVYDKTSVIDCELIVYAVDELIAETLKRGDERKKLIIV